jgi:hypothetical protein
VVHLQRLDRQRALLPFSRPWTWFCKMASDYPRSRETRPIQVHCSLSRHPDSGNTDSNTRNAYPNSANTCSDAFTDQPLAWKSHKRLGACVISGDKAASEAA